MGILYSYVSFYLKETVFIRKLYRIYYKRRKELDEDLDDLFPGQSGDISAVNFSPEWFLLENHISTSYNDLCAGVKHLERKVKNQKEGEIAFLKVNNCLIIFSNVRFKTLKHLITAGSFTERPF